MTNEDIIKRLESVTLPDISLEGHQRELRAALLREYSKVKTGDRRTGLFGYLQFRTPVWKGILITSAAWMLIILVITLSVLVPRSQSNSVEAMAVNAVIAAPEVRAVLAGDEPMTVTITNLGNNLFEVIVESRGGTIIIARTNAKGNRITITEISYVILLGSPYQPEEQITGKELETVMNVANTDPAFRELFSKGAQVVKTVAVKCIISKRNLISNETMETRETWAMVQLDYQGSTWYFLIDPNNNRVINISNKAIPK